MTEEQQPQQRGQSSSSHDQAQPEQAQPEQAQRPSLVTELQELGLHLETAFKAAVRSIQQQAPRMTEIEQQARRAAQQVQQAPLMRDIESTLVSGLQQINQQLRRLVEHMDAPAEEPGSAAPSGQRLQIEVEPGPDTAAGEPPASRAGSGDTPAGS